MNHLKWGQALLALFVLGSCSGPRRAPAPEDLQASAWWRPGSMEASYFAGSDAIDPARRSARGRLALGILPAPRDTTHFGMAWGIAAPPPQDTSFTELVIDRRTLEPIAIRLEGVSPPWKDLVRARPVRADSIRLEFATGGEARSITVAWPDTSRPHAYWDALPLWLRQWAGGKKPFEMPVWLLPPLSEMLAGGPAKPVEAVIRRMDGGVIETPAGRFDAVEFAVASGGEADAFWFATSEPHKLLKVQTARHLTLVLREVALQPTLP